MSVSFLCALQYNTLTECRGAKLATTFCTNNLRQMTIHLFDAAKNRSAAPLRKAGIYAAVILAFAAGAVGGAFAAQFFGNYCTLLAAALLLPSLLFLLLRPAAHVRAQPARRPGRRGQKIKKIAKSGAKSFYFFRKIMYNRLCCFPKKQTEV